MLETWKAVPGYEGLYEVSDQGRVRKGEKILSQTPLRSGHLSVRLQQKFAYVHRVVLLAFVGPPEEYAAGTRVECRHIDGDPSNNVVTNLAWGTVKENRADRRRLGEKAKLCVETARLLQSDARRGMLIKDIAAKYGIDRHTAARYRDGRMYGRLD